MVNQPPRWYDESVTDPFLKSLAETRRLAARQGCCYQHVQALMVAIDQYAEAATGNRSYFLDKPHSIGGSRRNSDVP
jgi:hypothetical protein